MQKKQIIQFAVLLALIAVLAGAYFGIRAYTEAENEKKQQEEDAAAVELISFEPDDITAVSYDYDGVQYTLEKKDGQWETGDGKTELDQDMAADFVKSAGAVTAQQEIQAEDGEDYGFDQPSRTVSVTAENDSVTLIFGSKNEMLDQYYVKKEGDSRIYLVEESVYSAYNKTAEDFEAVETEADTETDADSETDAETGADSETDAETETKD